MTLTILTDLSNYIEIVESTKKKWLMDLLSFMNLDIKYLETLDSQQATEYISGNHIVITDYIGIGALKIEKVSDQKIELIGEWGGPIFSYKKDHNNQPYYEISVDCWTIADDEIDFT